MPTMRSAISTIIVGLVLSAAPAGAAGVDSTQALAKLGFPADTQARVLAGQFVETALPATSERDLNVGIAFLVKTSPERLTRQLFDELLLQRTDPSVAAYGKLAGDDGSNAFSKLTLSAAQQKSYAAAEPGATLNLSAEEIAAIRAVGKDPATIWNKLRELLWARHRTYKAKGLAGIAPYARRKGTTSPGDELAGFSKAARANGLLPVPFYNLLEGYPPGTPPPLTESYLWSEFKANDVDTIVLSHVWAGTFGNVIVGVQRQYYVSAGYNAEQAIAGFIPVEEGTLVVYTNHTSTDQVAGLGGGAKRSIGRKIMAGQLEALFKKMNAVAEK